MGRRPNTLADFWGKVAVSDDPDACWLWKLSTFPDGYGQFKCNGVNRRAHKVAYEIANGITLPVHRVSTKDTLSVLHTCDVPRCCNPAHLWLGTPIDNLRDASAKGRIPRGENSHATRHPERMARGSRNGKYTKPEQTPRGSCHGNSKLVEADIPIIRARRASGEGPGPIARDYGVAPLAIWMIVTGRSWKHVR